MSALCLCCTRFCQQVACFWTKFLLRINFSAATCQSSWSFAALRPLSKYFTVRLASSWEAIVADFAMKGKLSQGRNGVPLVIFCIWLLQFTSTVSSSQTSFDLQQMFNYHTNSASSEIQDLSAMGQDAEGDQRVSFSARILITSRTSHLALAVGNAQISWSQVRNSLIPSLWHPLRFIS